MKNLKKESHIFQPIQLTFPFRAEGRRRGPRLRRYSRRARGAEKNWGPRPRRPCANGGQSAIDCRRSWRRPGPTFSCTLTRRQRSVKGRHLFNGSKKYFTVLYIRRVCVCDNWKCAPHTRLTLCHRIGSLITCQHKRLHLLTWKIELWTETSIYNYAANR